MANPPQKFKVNNLVSAIPEQSITKNGFENRRYSEKNFKLKNQTQNLKEQLFSGSDEKASARESKFELEKTQQKKRCQDSTGGSASRLTVHDRNQNDSKMSRYEVPVKDSRLDNTFQSPQKQEEKSLQFLSPNIKKPLTAQEQIAKRPASQLDSQPSQPTASNVRIVIPVRHISEYEPNSLNSPKLAMQKEQELQRSAYECPQNTLASSRISKGSGHSSGDIGEETVLRN